MTTLRIATRESKLALTQTQWLAQRIEAANPGLATTLVRLTTTGDRVQDRPLAEVGGKGLFVKELEMALLDGRADIAIHSAKDVPIVLDSTFALAFTAPREDARDAWLSPRYAHPADLPAGAVVGTSSLRRAAQLEAAHPHLQTQLLRGNVDTRLAKLDAGQYDAIVLAAAGLNRLGLAKRITALLPVETMLPAIAQGVLAVEHLANRHDVAELIAPLTHADLTAAITAERALGLVLEGSCEVPLAGHASVSNGTLTLHGLIASPDGKQLAQGSTNGAAIHAEALGRDLGARLLAEGGASIRALLPRAKNKGAA
jgi:hydroxymethylbilane synthase